MWQNVQHICLKIVTKRIILNQCYIIRQTSLDIEVEASKFRDT